MKKRKKSRDWAVKRNQDPERRKRGKKEKVSGDSNMGVKRKEEIKIRSETEKGIRRRRQCRKRWKFQPKRTNEIEFE